MLGEMLHALFILAASVVTLGLGPGDPDVARASATQDESLRVTETEFRLMAAAPGTEAEPIEPGPGETGPGAGESRPGQGDQRPRERSVPLPREGSRVYVDRVHGFQLSCPPGFVVRPQDASRLAQHTPTPLVSIFFMNPTMAAGALAGIEPPDLDLRVYQVGPVDSLKDWLVSVGFVSRGGGAQMQPYRVGTVAGLKVCESTMIAPGCSVYILSGRRVYQLTAGSVEGEAMVRSFVLLP